MNYKLRREKLLEMLPEYSITVMYSGVAPYSIGDEKYPFKVDRSFYYFTGIERENLYLVLIKLSAAKSSEMLFIEPFDEKMTVEYLKGKWAKCKKPIKTSLLDQRVICGLGNIYADEVCFMVKVNPKQETNSLSDSQLQAIIDDSKEVLTKAISLGGTTIKSFVNSHSATGLFQNELLVHTKEVCPNCSGKIEKIVVGGRGTYYCPNCQKLNS